MINVNVTFNVFLLSLPVFQLNSNTEAYSRDVRVFLLRLTGHLTTYTQTYKQRTCKNWTRNSKLQGETPKISPWSWKQINSDQRDTFITETQHRYYKRRYYFRWVMLTINDADHFWPRQKFVQRHPHSRWPAPSTILFFSASTATLTNDNSPGQHKGQREITHVVRSSMLL